MRETLPSAILSALAKAAWLHRYQRRKGSEDIPYINHPIKVTLFLAECGHNNTELLQAAALHDVLEDTEITADELTATFSQRVTSLVEEMTDDMNLPSAKRKELQITHAPALSVDAAKIKIADKTCNIEDLLEYNLSWSAERKQKYVQWAEMVVRNIVNPDPCILERFEKVLNSARQALKF